jgi:hypothetical protein
VHLPYKGKALNANPSRGKKKRTEKKKVLVHLFNVHGLFFLTVPVILKAY